MRELIAAAEAGEELTVDLEAQTVSSGAGAAFPFELDAFQRHCLLEGLDEIGLTLAHVEAIDAYEARLPERVPTTSL